jgi:hypothetical protein
MRRRPDTAVTAYVSRVLLFAATNSRTCTRGLIPLAYETHSRGFSATANGNSGPGRYPHSVSRTTEPPGNTGFTYEQ